MSIKQLRAGIRAWIGSITRIDAWDLDTPKNVPTVLSGVRYPANCAIEMPVKSFGLRRVNGTTEADGRFNYTLLYRFSGKASKHQLPMPSVENLVNYLAERAVREPQLLWEDILELDVDEIADPVNLARIEGEDGDWLIVAQLEMQIRFISYATAADSSNLQPVAPSVEPPAISQIRIGLNRSWLPEVEPDDPASYTRDRLIQIPYEEP